VHVLDVQVGQDVADLLLHACFFEQVAVGVGGNGKTVRHGNALAGQMLVHLTERGIFPAHQGHVVNADLIKPED